LHDLQGSAETVLAGGVGDTPSRPNSSAISVPSPSKVAPQHPHLSSASAPADYGGDCVDFVTDNSANQNSYVSPAPALTVPLSFDAVDAALMESLQNENRMIVLKCENFVLQFVHSRYFSLWYFAYLNIKMNHILSANGSSNCVSP
jgi:hypothetical protein